MRNVIGLISDTEKLADGDNRVGSSCRGSLEPHDTDSMEFESKEDAFQFYKEYASSLGFSAIIKASRRSRISGQFIDAKFVCSRYGSKRGTCSSENSAPGDATLVNKKPGRTNRSWSKTDCKACMHVKTRQDGRWIISSFMREHNHDLVVVLDGCGGRLKEKADICRHNVRASLNAVRFRRKKTCVSLSRESGEIQNTEYHESNVSNSTGSRLGFCE